MNKQLITSSTLFVLLSTVVAAQSPFDPLGELVAGIFKNPVAQMGLLFTLLFFLLLGIFMIGLTRVPAFKTADGKLSKPGKIIALTLSLITVLALFAMGDPIAITTKLFTGINNIVGVLVIAIITIVFYSLFRNPDNFGGRHFGPAAAALGLSLSLTLVGNIGGKASLIASGTLTFFLAVALFIWTFMHHGREEDEGWTYKAGEEIFGEGGGSSKKKKKKEEKELKVKDQLEDVEDYFKQASDSYLSLKQNLEQIQSDLENVVSESTTSRSQALEWIRKIDATLRNEQRLAQLQYQGIDRNELSSRKKALSNSHGQFNGIVGQAENT